MAVIIEMPKLSDTMEEGGISNWLKKEGDEVAEGEPLVEIETDKATMEFESPEAGILLKIILPAGKKCALNAPIAVIGEKGENPDDILGGKKDVKEEKPSATDKKPSAAELESPKPKSAPAKSNIPNVSKSAPPSANPSKPSTSSTGASSNSSSERIKASPLAKKVAEEKGISLALLTGSGPQGRVVIRDVEAAVSSGGTNSADTSSPNVTAEDKLINVNMMRSTIAKRLLAAKNDAPHFYLTRSVNMAKLNTWRESLNKDLKDENAKVSVNDLLIMMSAKALTQHPDINSSWQGEHIKQFGHVHVAFAVALPNGLVTPVVKDANMMGARSIAKTTKSLAKQARDGANLDYTSGTFTISNLGMLGIEEFTAIINPPQSAILAVGATIPTPWVDAAGQVVVEPRMKMTMSCDHRVIDGAMGAKFLATLASYLEDPLMSMS